MVSTGGLVGEGWVLGRFLQANMLLDIGACVSGALVVEGGARGRRVWGERDGWPTALRLGQCQWMFELTRGGLT